MPTFAIHGSWLVELRDGSGLVLLTAAERGHSMAPLTWIAATRASALQEDSFELRESARGWHFVLLDPFGEVFAGSPVYPGRRECMRALQDVLHVLPTAPLDPASLVALHGGGSSRIGEPPDRRPADECGEAPETDSGRR